MHFKQVKSLLSASNGMNIYRGCTHGCIYCDSRSKCYGMEHDFEDVEVKINAPELLEAALRKKRTRCMIGTGSMSDCYMHCEMELNHTRKCLEIIERYGFGLSIQTKSDRILRDLDLLKAIHQNAKCVVQITLTTFDESLCKIIEPNVATTRRRFEVLKIMQENGIPTVVWLDPVLPFVNDTEENLLGILNYCVEAGVYGIICFGMGLTLREGSREYFYRQLDRHFPGLKEIYHQKYGYRYELLSDNNQELMRIFYDVCRANDIVCNNDAIFTYLNTYQEKHGVAQISLFP